MKPHINLAALAPLDGVESATSAWVAFECEMILGQELSASEEQMHADLVTSAKVNELEAWGKFKVPPPASSSSLSKDTVDTRWVLTWKLVDGQETVKARLVAKGLQDPDLQEGLVDTSGCVSLRSSHLQVISLSAIKNGDCGA